MLSLTKVRRWFRVSPTPAAPRFADLSPDEIRRERIRIEQTELKITREIEELENQKTALFAKGTSCDSDRQRVQIARKIKEIDGVIRAKDQQLGMISKNQRVQQGVAQLKENERLLRDLGMEGLVGKMDLSELQRFVEQSTIEGQFQMERFTKLLESIDGAEATFNTTGEDAETLAILDAMQKATVRPVAEPTATVVVQRSEVDADRPQRLEHE